MPASDNAVMLGPWGRTVTGQFWKYELPDELPNELPQQTLIEIGYGNVINYIKVKPQRSDLGVDAHTAKVPLGPNAFIKEYSFGFSEPDAKYLSWISFLTNTDRLYGPYGTVTSSKFSFTVTKGKPVAFFGWNETPISSFGVQLAASDNLVKVGPWGPTDNAPNWRHNLSDVHAPRTNITIRSEGLIDMINIEPGDPRESGGDTIKIPIGPDELIKDYFIYTEPDSKCLSALSFSTNKDTKGTYGTVTTSVFPLPVTKGKLVGFFGYKEDPINSIGFEFTP